MLRPLAIIRLASPLLALLLASCSGIGPASYHLSNPPGTGGRKLLHYPVARQGDLSAWLASDHVLPSGRWLFAPDDSDPSYPIVGIIRARDMPQGVKHDGAFLVVSGYRGPLFDLWQGREASGRLFNGSGDWLPVLLHQDDAVNTWVKTGPGQKIGGWSGYPVVIGDPAHPDAVAGAMWYRKTTDHGLGGATSTRMLGRRLSGLRLADFADAR